MDIFHVQVICCHGIGDGVLGQSLWSLACIPESSILDQVRQDRTQVLRPSLLSNLDCPAEIAVSIDPVETVHVDTVVALYWSSASFLPANLLIHVNSIDACSRIHEWPIEEVSVVSRDYGWPSFLDVQEESLNDRLLIRLIEYHEWPGILALACTRNRQCPPRQSLGW